MKETLDFLTRNRNNTLSIKSRRSVGGNQGWDVVFSDGDIDDAFHSLRLHKGAFRIYFLGWEQQSAGANHS